MGARAMCAYIYLRIRYVINTDLSFSPFLSILSLSIDLLAVFNHDENVAHEDHCSSMKNLIGIRFFFLS